MKKILFSVLVIGTFSTYAVFVQQNGKDVVNTPVIVSNAQPSVPIADVTAPVTPPQEATQTAPTTTPDVATTTQSATHTATVAVATNMHLDEQAQGTVTIVSTYPANATLVKTTRIVTADGKLYRLSDTITIPPKGTVTAKVYADQNGSLYAIAPTTFTIPGLASNLQQYFTVTSDATFVLAKPLSTTVAVATPAPTPASTPKPTPTPAPTPAPVVKPKGQYNDGSYTGDSVDAYYGNVQVQAVVSGGKITDVIFLDHPQDRSRSVYINEYAMPILKSEAIQAQSANVDAVSGASATSAAFIQSLGSALAQAKV